MLLGVVTVGSGKESVDCKDVDEDILVVLLAETKVMSASGTLNMENSIPGKSNNTPRVMTMQVNGVEPANSIKTSPCGVVQKLLL